MVLSKQSIVLTENPKERVLLVSKANAILHIFKPPICHQPVHLADQSDCQMLAIRRVRGAAKFSLLSACQTE